jgi:hypothetical protein
MDECAINRSLRSRDSLREDVNKFTPHLKGSLEVGRHPSQHRTRLHTPVRTIQYDRLSIASLRTVYHHYLGRRAKGSYGKPHASCNHGRVNRKLA